MNLIFMPPAGSFIHQTLNTNIYNTCGFYYRVVEVILVLVDIVILILVLVIAVVVTVVVVVTLISLINLKASVSWSQKVC